MAAHEVPATETHAGHHRHHLLCRDCGRTEDVDCAMRVTPSLDPAGSSGYAVDDAEVVFWGVCPECRSERERTAGN